MGKLTKRNLSAAESGGTGGNARDTAELSNEGTMMVFSFGGQRIRMLGPKCLKKIVSVKKWDKGYLEMIMDYGEVGHNEEDYLDLRSVLDNLYIDSERFLRQSRKSRW